MKRTWMMSGLIACGLATGATLVARATGPETTSDAGGRDRPLAQWLMGRLQRTRQLASKLNLSPSQREAIRSVLTSHRAEIARVIKPVIERGRALRDAATADNSDESAIRDAAAELGKALGDAAVVGSSLRREIKAQARLTDEQLDQIRQFRLDSQSAVNDWLERMSHD